MDDAAKGQYLCCFYKTQQQRQSSAAQFVRDGLRRNRRILLIAQGDLQQSLRREIQSSGIEIEKLIQSGQVSFQSPEGIYLSQGRFEPSRPLQFLEESARNARSNGFEGIHVATEMDWAARSASRQGLMGFIADLRQKLDQLPIEVLEQYSREAFDPTFLLEVLSAHPHVADEEQVYENLYYLPQSTQAGPEQSDTILSELLDSLTRRKRVEQALRQSEKHFRTLVETAGSPIVVIDSDYKIRQFNHASEALHGTLSDENVGEDYCRLLYEEHRGPFRQAVSNVMEGNVVQGLEVELPDEFGDRRRVLWNLTPLRDWHGSPCAVIGVGQDVTDHRRADENVAQAQKLETIGQLAGGIAHHFNNLLTIIMGNAELMQRSLPGESDCQHMSEQVIQAAQRASDLTSQLLAFARKGRFRMERVNVSELLERSVQLLSVTIDKRVEIHLNLRPAPCYTRGDASQLENVFLNLCLNARDAMPQGGVVEISNDIVEIDEPGAKRIDIAPGRYVCVAVCDTGVGMDTETRRRIFEPFFTTKEVGKGAGLGLASVYGCVRNHGGGVEVHSEKGEGTTFRVYLPVAQEPQTQEAPKPEKGHTSPGTLLLVDDEESVRAFGAKVLRGLGYQVHTCANGAEAVEIFAKNPRRFDLVILDMVMPKLDGLDTFRRMKQIEPGIRAMLSSGFSIGDLPGEILEEGVLDFLAKPYRIDQLSQKVQRAIQKG
jgi:PAS domain S-box-containing protein